MKSRLVLLVFLCTQAQASGDACKNYKTQGSSSVGQQRAAYCTAADAADEAAKGQKSSAMIQAGVAAVCTLACTKSMFSFGLGEGWCSAASIAGMAGSMMVSKNAQNNMSGMAMNLGSVMMSTQMDMGDFSTSFKLGGTEAATGAPAVTGAETASLPYAERAGDVATGAGDAANQAASGAEKGGSKMSCLSAAMSAMQAMMSQQGAKDSEETARKNRALAAALQDDQGQAANVQAGNPFKASGGAPAGTSGASPLGRGAGLGLSEDSRSAKPKSPCGTAGFDGALACASADPNSNLPTFVSTPEFKNALEKATGMSADRFVDSGDVKSAIQAGMLKALGPSGADKVGSILAEAQANLLPNGSAYASGGRGYGGGGSDPEMDLNGMLDRILGKKDAPESAKKTNERFSSRALASQAGDEENPRLSLFARVSSRYQLSQNRVSPLQYVGESNAHLRQQR